MISNQKQTLLCVLTDISMKTCEICWIIVILRLCWPCDMIGKKYKTNYDGLNYMYSQEFTSFDLFNFLL